MTKVILYIYDNNNLHNKIHVGSYLSVSRFDKNFLRVLETIVHKQLKVQLFKDVNFQDIY